MILRAWLKPMIGAEPIQKPKTAAAKAKSTYMMKVIAADAVLSDETHHLEVEQKQHNRGGEVAHISEERWCSSEQNLRIELRFGKAKGCRLEG